VLCVACCVLRVVSSAECGVWSVELSVARCVLRVEC